MTLGTLVTGVIYRYPAFSQRLSQQMWAGTVPPFAGKHYQLAETLNQPQPVQQPRPRIMTGGTGEQKTLRMVAQYADACNLFDRLTPLDIFRDEIIPAVADF